MFYKNFEAICKSRDTSPFAVTHELGLSRATASGWKKNNTIPKQEILDQLAEILHCNVSDFFKTDRERFVYQVVSLDNSSSTDTIQLDENMQDFIFIYESCTNRQRNQLMSMVYDFEQKVLNP